MLSDGLTHKLKITVRFFVLSYTRKSSTSLQIMSRWPSRIDILAFCHLSIVPYSVFFLFLEWLIELSWISNVHIIRILSLSHPPGLSRGACSFSKTFLYFIPDVTSKKFIVFSEQSFQRIARKMVICECKWKKLWLNWKLWTRSKKFPPGSSAIHQLCCHANMWGLG